MYYLMKYTKATHCAIHTVHSIQGLHYLITDFTLQKTHFIASFVDILSFSHRKAATPPNNSFPLGRSPFFIPAASSRIGCQSPVDLVVSTMKRDFTAEACILHSILVMETRWLQRTWTLEVPCANKAPMTLRKLWMLMK